MRERKPQEENKHRISIAPNIRMKTDLNIKKSLPPPLSSPQIRKVVCQSRWATRQSAVCWDWSWT